MPTSVWGSAAVAVSGTRRIPVDVSAVGSPSQFDVDALSVYLGAEIRTLTNKTINGASNTIIVLAATQLTGAVPIANGGTAAITAADARISLGVQIGLNVQAWDADLDLWAAKTAPAGVVVGTTDAQVLTNKTINGASNTIIVLAATQLSGLVPIANGGLAVALAAPGADRLLKWDHATLQYVYATLGTNLSWVGSTINAASGGGGLTGFTAAESTTSPNTTTYADSFTASGTTPDADAILAPKNQGAIAARVPDSTSTGGNKGGTYSTNWQRSMGAASQVASGTWSVVSGGHGNTASAQDSSVGGGRENGASATSASVGGGLANNATGIYSTVAGGKYSTASGSESTIGGGNSNSATAQNAVIGGGRENTASGMNSVVAGGTLNTVSGNGTSVLGGNNNIVAGSNSSCIGGGSNTSNTGNHSIVGGLLCTTADGTGMIALGVQCTASTANYCVAIGVNNIASGEASIAVGGQNNTASGSHSSISGGTKATTRGLTGSWAHASNFSSTQGNMQEIGQIVTAATTDATPKVLTVDGAAAAAATVMVLPNNSTFIVSARCGARSSAGASIGFILEATFKRGANAAATSLVGAVTSRALGADVAVNTASFTLIADTTLGAVVVQFTGVAATNMTPGAVVEGTQIL